VVILVKKIILIIIVMMLFFVNKEEKVISTFNESDINYSMYLLSFPNKNISTNNFDQYFNNLKVIYIESSINNQKNKYSFDTSSVKNNINKYKNNIIKHLNNSGDKKIALNYKINGIVIDEALIYCTDKDILFLSNQIENIIVQKSD